MGKSTKDPIQLTGRVFVTAKMEDLCPSRAMPSQLRRGDLRVFSHYTQGATTAGAGSFRASVYDGSKWRKFRLNKVAGEHARYSSYDDRKNKVVPCIHALDRLKDCWVSWIKDSYGIYDVGYHPGPQSSAAKTGKEPATGRDDARGKSRRKSDDATGGAQQLTLFD